MASRVSPGVILRERDLTNVTIVGSSTLTAALASSFQKGPIGEVTPISSLKDLVETFGTPSESNYLSKPGSSEGKPCMNLLPVWILPPVTIYFSCF